MCFEADHSRPRGGRSRKPGPRWESPGRLGRRRARPSSSRADAEAAPKRQRNLSPARPRLHRSRFLRVNTPVALFFQDSVAHFCTAARL